MADVVHLPEPVPEVENGSRWSVLMALYFIACDTSRTPGDRFEFIARRLVDWEIAPR